MVKEEISGLESNRRDHRANLKVLLIPKDPNDDKNVIMEVRGAAGGDEAALFAGDLFRMYSRYADARLEVEVMEASPRELAAIKRSSL